MIYIDTKFSAANLLTISFFALQIQRYNYLLNEIRKSLTDLELGIQGMVVMTLDLENIFQCIFDGHVPPTWEKVNLKLCFMHGLQTMILVCFCTQYLMSRPYFTYRAYCSSI